MQHSFEWVQAALGIIVALGLTRIVSAIVLLHSMRRRVRLDWIPVAWAATVFLLLLQFSWVFVGLRDFVENWTFGLFLCLLGFVLTLFTAAALVLPGSEAQAGEDLEAWFARDGRWALPFLGLYALFSYGFNWYFGGSGPETNPASAIMIVLAAVAFRARPRWARASAAAINLVLTVAIAIEMARTG